MSIVFERNNSDHRVERSGLVHKMSVYNSSEHGVPTEDRQSEEDLSGESSLSSSISSLGRNSDESSSDGERDVEEVQSKYKGGPLDSLEALEEVLPIKRGISKFYNGKSKSYTSLAEAASGSSVKEIAKPDDAYTRKRKNLLAHSNFFNKSYDNLRASNIGGLSKRCSNSKSTLSIGGLHGSHSNSESSNSDSSSPLLTRPPLPPQSRRASNNEPPSSSVTSSEGQKFPSWRSFSLSDLQGAVTTANPSNTGRLEMMKEN